MAEAMVPASYPVTFEVEYPEELSRWLIFVKWLLAIPHFIILYILSVATNLITFVAFFIILFTKQYPRELFDFVVNVQRWSANLSAYTSLMRDEYPPFSWEPGQYPVTYDVEYPEELSRWLIFIKWLLIIPHLFVILLLYIALSAVMIIAWFAILFTKQYPESLFQYALGVLRWQARVNAYINLQRDEYPPFTLDP